MTAAMLVAIIAIWFHLGLTGGLRFAVLGDWGVTRPGNEGSTTSRRQVAVAQALNEWAAGGLDFVATSGDNFYPRGVDTALSERFNVTWRAVYDKPNLRGVPWYIAAGNHDYKRQREPTGDQEFALVKRSSESATWVFPNLWHSSRHLVGPESSASELHLVVIDTTALLRDLHDRASQMAWLLRELATSTALWKVVVGHHPVYCLGKMGPTTPMLVRDLLPLLREWGVNFYISGHDHALQHLRDPSLPGTDFLVSAAGGKEPYPRLPRSERVLGHWRVANMAFFSTNGFVGIDIQERRAQVEFVDHQSTVLHRYTRTADVT